MAGHDWPRETPHLPTLQLAPSLLFIYISFTIPKSYKYLSFSIPLHFLFFFHFIKALTSTNSSFISTITSTITPSSLQGPATPFGLGPCSSPLVRRKGPVPSFWIGAELPFAGRSKYHLGRVFILAKT